MPAARRITTIEGLARRRHASSRAARLRRARCDAVRLLHAGDGHELRRAGRAQPRLHARRCEGGGQRPLCRCGTYPNIFAATLAAARARRSRNATAPAETTNLDSEGRRAMSTSMRRPLARAAGSLRHRRRPPRAGDAARAGRRAAAARRERDAAGDRQASAPARRRAEGHRQGAIHLRRPAPGNALRPARRQHRSSRADSRHRYVAGGAVSRSACGARAGPPAADRAAPRSLA